MDKSWPFLTDVEYYNINKMFDTCEFHDLVKKYPHHVELFWIHFITNYIYKLTKEILNFFIGESIDINKKFEFSGVCEPKSTPLEHACEYRNVNMLKLLFDAGAIGTSKLIGVALYGHSPLDLDDCHGCEDIIKILDANYIQRTISKKTYFNVHNGYNNNVYLHHYLESCHIMK
jgi:hypothetical protein